MVGLNKKHKRLHKALACALRCDHFINRFVSLGTAEAILNVLAPADKALPKAFLENGALNSMDANYILASALSHHPPTQSHASTLLASSLLSTLFPATR